MTIKSIVLLVGVVLLVLAAFGVTFSHVALLPLGLAVSFGSFLVG